MVPERCSAPICLQVFNRVNGDYLDAYFTDDAMPSGNNTTVQYFTNGRINVLQITWRMQYGATHTMVSAGPIFTWRMWIRCPNTALKTYGRLKPVLQVMFYFELLKDMAVFHWLWWYGFTLNDNLELPRAIHFEQCVNYIVSEVRWYQNKLRVEVLFQMAIGDMHHVELPLPWKHGYCCMLPVRWWTVGVWNQMLPSKHWQVIRLDASRWRSTGCSQWVVALN